MEANMFFALFDKGYFITFIMFRENFWYFCKMFISNRSSPS
nr:MAG TPA: hypothetical protein [Caudoviricetes sp.]